MVWSSKSSEVTALIIDAANAYQAAKAAGFRMDYDKIRKHFRPQQSLFYTALPENDKENNPNSLFKMLDWASYNGYTLISKPTKTFMNNGVSVMKGNMDIEICLGIIRSATWANHVVLFSGDGDFRSVVEYVQHQGVRVTVVSALRTNPPLIADELRRQANNFLDICDPEFRRQIIWEGRDHREVP